MTQYIVTGSHGWIGRRLVQKLKEAGKEPVCVDIASREHKYDGGIDVVAIGSDWFKPGCVVLHFAVTGGDEWRREDELAHLRILLNRAADSPSLFVVKAPKADAAHVEALKAVVDECAKCPVKLIEVGDLQDSDVDKLYADLIAAEYR